MRKLSTNPLGNQIAEHDLLQLEKNYIETPELRSILETSDRSVVIGRRGTGKSAMAWKLGDIWSVEKSNHVTRIEPEDYQNIAFRGIFSGFNDSFTLTRAAARIAWKYIFLMEILSGLNKGYKTKATLQSMNICQSHLSRWGDRHRPVLDRAASRLRAHFKVDDAPEAALGEIPSDLELAELEREISEVFQKSKMNLYLLIDRLDEGFQNDQIGAAIVSAAISVISEYNQRFVPFRSVIFIRDNVNKAIENFDQDYSRNVEGEVIRLHWNQHQLLRMVSKRLNSVFEFDLENDQKIWDRAVADEGYGKELKGKAGFRKCLQFTLYRPRDLLSLLNQAFLVASREERQSLIFSDIEQTAKSISKTRFEDLKKEYASVIPSVKVAVEQFKNRSPNLTYDDAIAHLDTLHNSSAWGDDTLGFQDFQILSSDGVIKALHAIGFIGNYDSGSDTFTFYHDGRSPEEELVGSKRLLIHPCYWMALSLIKDALSVDQAEQINDEYEIKVASQTPEIRAARIGSLISELTNIPEGKEGASQFEEWTEHVIQTVFAGHVDNIQRNANAAALQRRDIVATNLDRTPVFSRILRDYQSRHVVFEVKNFQEVGADEFRQVIGYLSGQYGKLAFMVTRSQEDNLTVSRELNWVREAHSEHGKLVILLTAKFLSKLLSKLRSPEKHDAVDKGLQALLDRYERNYLGIQAATKSRQKRRQMS